MSPPPPPLSFALRQNLVAARSPSRPPRPPPSSGREGSGGSERGLSAKPSDRWGRRKTREFAGVGRGRGLVMLGFSKISETKAHPFRCG